MTKQMIRRVKCGCFLTSASMSVVANLSPILFLTFRSLYGISFSLLGLLVLINFSVQLIVDLILSFFSHKFDMKKTVKLTPAFSALGLVIYALYPFLFPETVYLGLVIGTVIFSAGSGLAEVLISPVVAAIPAKDPDREMSKLHSIYAWGTVAVIFICTGFIILFGSENWQYLALVFALIPTAATIVFSKSDIPEMATPEKTSGALDMLKNKGVWLCITAIFLGGAAECTMAQWCSGYLEGALGIEKVWGDIFGTAVFSVMLGLGRSLYGKFGKDVGRVIFFGSAGAVICYFTAAVSSNAFVGLIACGLTGFCVSMLWPGNLVAATDRFPQGGVFIYAIMAAGGDLGASVGPQLIGVVTDLTIASEKALALAENFGITAEQFGMKLGMLVGMLFPLAGCFVYYGIWKKKKV